MGSRGRRISLAADPQVASAATLTDTVERILDLALHTHRSHDCNRVEAMLAVGGERVSAITIQKTPTIRGLGTRYDRRLALEKRTAETPPPIVLTGEQVAFLEKQNPCFRECRATSRAACPANRSAPIRSSLAT
jgi:hypothetical protein